MWIVEEFKTVPVTLDFTSSGQGRCKATAVHADGVCLFNAIELVEVEPDATQIYVCECCGFSHCSPGNWVTFRRIGDSIIWLPAWDEMEKGEFEASEYQPPSFLASKGSPYFSLEAWIQLRAIKDSLPHCEDVPEIDSREASQLYQWSAPGRVLGKYPAVPRVRQDLAIAVTDGDLVSEVDAVNQCLRSYYEGDYPMECIEGNESMAPIEFWIDIPGTPAWKSFVHIAGYVSFLIDDSTALVQKGLTKG